VKSGFYDSLLFHRVIAGFMIQTGDPDSRRAAPGKPLGSNGGSYLVPAEFRPSLFHKKGALAAARQGDAVNPERKSSGSQFYVVQGRTFTDREMDSIETYRLRGVKIPDDRRAYYRTVGGTPQLDQNYTVFGEVVEGLDVIDRIAGVKTSMGADHDRPLTDTRILKMKLVKRKKHPKQEQEEKAGG
jgi:cyclophilin family peptidyl-prolyl cis-trans isomerase